MITMGPRFTPDELRRCLGLPYQFSAEQVRAISAPPHEPLLVVAGAGSGKTELMALRVVWLVANAHVRPDQVLGLTFTRKAAGELAHRIRSYLSRARLLTSPDDYSTGEPTVSTYHSFAARIVREHGLRSGFEPGTRLLTEAACWQLADAVVRGHDSPAMRSFPLGPDAATAAVLTLSAELSEHLRDPDDLAKFTLGLTAAIEGRSLPKPLQPVAEVLARQRGRLALLPLVEAYAESKRSLEAMDFGDQLRRAATVAREHPEVAQAERERYRVVLLDEYQDTSEAQLVLLRCLFGDGHPVTAVGDPCQSIYGWRGASAGTLERFGAHFPRSTGERASVAELTVSWRNAPGILAVANHISRNLRGAEPAPARKGGLAPGELRAAPTYQPRFSGAAVRAAFLASYLDEARYVAEQIDAAWQEWQSQRGKPPTTAVLVRARSQISTLERALRERGLPVEVVGLGGLLDTPEVRDVVATLHVLADPTAGAALLRLLTGARWRIGPRDLVALYRRARSLAVQRASASGIAASNTLIEEPDLGGERLDEAVLLEALDDLGPEAAYSPEGWRRLGQLRDELRGLRSRLDQSLPDLVADVAATIGLDVEVAVHATAGTLARAHLDAIGDVAARFAEETEGGTLPAFLAFLSAAEEEERGLPPGEVEVVDGAVQIMTIHAAKGLEWDVVSVAGLSQDAFPAKPRSSDHWLKGIGVLPFPLRGDRDGLPKFAFEAATSAAEVRDAVNRFDEEWREHQEREERRLAYVAVTRPRHLLLATGYRWGDGLTQPREPSVFLTEIADACRAGAGEVTIWIDELAEGETNPTLAEEVSACWPLDPLGPRRAPIAQAADMVRKAIEEGRSGAGAAAARKRRSAAKRQSAAEPERPSAAEPERPSAAEPEAAGPERQRGSEKERQWAAEVDLLLAERERLAATSTIDVVLPEHVSVSLLVALRRNPQQLARRLRRPLPEAPDVYARRGTAFHLWLEQRFGAAALLDLDDLPGAGDEGAAADEELAELQKAFLASEFADRMPCRVEVPFATVIGGVVVRGRMDAVFETGVPGHYDVIDWKTGQRPTGTDAAAAAVQLAVYRLAWAELAGVPVAQVSAGFHYVRAGLTVRPADLLDHDALVSMITSLPA